MTVRAHARIVEKDGKCHWIVFWGGSEVVRGESTSFSGARGACRKVVRKLDSK